MKHLVFLFLLACSTPDSVPTTGCWTGVLNGKRVLIDGRCFTQAEVVKAEQSQSWALILQQYSDLKYETVSNCETCHQKYPL